MHARMEANLHPSYKFKAGLKNKDFFFIFLLRVHILLWDSGEKVSGILRVKLESILLFTSYCPPWVLNVLPIDWSVGRADVIFLNRL